MKKILKMFVCVILCGYCCLGFAQSVSDFVAEFNVSHYNFENKYLNNYVTIEVKRFSNIYLDKNPSIAIINNSGYKIEASFNNKQNLKHYLSRVDYSRDITLRGKLNKIQNTNKGVVFLLEDCDVNEYDSSNEFEFGGPFDIQQYLRDVAYIGKWGNDEKARELKSKYFYYDKVKFNGTISQISKDYGENIVYVSNPDFGTLEFHLCKGYYDNFTIDDLKGAFLGHPIDIFGHILFSNGKIFWRDIRDCRFDISYSELEQVVNDIKNEKVEKALQDELQRMQAEEVEKMREQEEEKRRQEEEKIKQDEEDKKNWEKEKLDLINAKVGDAVNFGNMSRKYNNSSYWYWYVLAVDGSKRLLFGQTNRLVFSDELNNSSWEKSHVRSGIDSIKDEILNKYEQSAILVTHNNYMRYYSKEKVINESSDDTIFVLSKAEYDLYINKNRLLQKKIYISDTILRDSGFDKNGQEHFMYVEQTDGKKPRYELTHGGRKYRIGVCVWIDTNK